MIVKWNKSAVGSLVEIRGSIPGKREVDKNCYFSTQFSTCGHHQKEENLLCIFG
jgi:hypothetical protein